MFTILVVDDSQVERLLIAGLLRGNSEYSVLLAENGNEALAKIESTSPDLVLTDLFMPEMDGLTLLRAVRLNYPKVPVILMTGFGDEATCVAALAAGAASYVPKSRQAECLLPTVERILAHSAGERSRARLAQGLLEFHCRYMLPNDEQLIRALVDQVLQVLAGMDFGDTVERLRMGEALQEALLNAMYHGNLEIGGEELLKVRAQFDGRSLTRLVEKRCANPRICERKILVVVHITTQKAQFVVRDQGRGFSVRYADVGPAGDHFEVGHNRGLMLMRNMMDVAFNETGNELTLRKFREGAVAAGHAL